MRQNKTANGTHNVILQVLANTRKIQQDVDTSSGQDIPRPNPALHQDIGASNRTGRQYNLSVDIDCGNGTAPDPCELDTGGIEVAVEQDLRNGSVGQDVEIVARGQRIDVSRT